LEDARGWQEEFYRGLHAHPELSHQEHATAAKVTITVIAGRTGTYGIAAAVCAALVCFSIRMIGVRFDLNAPRPRGQRDGESRS
jgi:metal-dependent amidase/aminoacylase/carboxypeptidase family protein